MNFDTYSGLKAAIATELDRTDMDSVIPGLIRLAEVQTERQLRVRQMLASTTITLDAVTEPLPADFLEARSFVIQGTPPTPMGFVTIENLEGVDAIPGKPDAYTVEGESFRFNRTPAGPFTARLTYYRTIPRLSDASPTNWLLLKAPDVLFYGALANSAPYLKEDARIATWAQFYQGAVDALSVEDDRAQTASNGLKAKSRMF